MADSRCQARRREDGKGSLHDGAQDAPKAAKAEMGAQGFSNHPAQRAGRIQMLCRWGGGGERRAFGCKFWTPFFPKGVTQNEPDDPPAKV